MAQPGGWSSPITAEAVTSAVVFLGEIAVDGADVLWTESDPRAGGRAAVFRGGARVTPEEFDVRSRVHEYGGGALTARDGRIYFTGMADQQLYLQDGDGSPVRLTSGEAHRYADVALAPDGRWLVCVREDHSDPDREPVNTLVWLDCRSGESRVLIQEHDFYASPRLSPDGRSLAFLAWNHPDMPWDGTELWLAELADGALSGARAVAGGRSESIFQPEWSPDGRLYFMSDRTDWWNLYRWEQDGSATALWPVEADCGLPQWVLGMSSYAFADADTVVCRYTEDGFARLARLDVRTGEAAPYDLPYTALRAVRATGTHAYFVAGAPDRSESVVELDLGSGAATELRASSEVLVGSEYLSVPESVWFPSDQGRRVHAFLYRPRNPDHRMPDGVLPPLLVMCHGGPTAAAAPSLHWSVQYWTSRGFAVLDVNYSGSSGFGRAYRQRLRGTWGVDDVADCAHGARYLAEQGIVDPERTAITGGSAGGFTVLCALAFHDTFRAGGCHYGVSDLTLLAKHTHKFESHYLDSLVGPYPAQEKVYRDRSPIRHVSRLTTPMIFFQGLLDAVVPPAQTEQMAAALRDAGIPVAMLLFPEERHGFTSADAIRRTMEAELQFYSRIFGFELSGPVGELRIDNLDD